MYRFDDYVEPRDASFVEVASSQRDMERHMPDENSIAELKRRASQHELFEMLTTPNLIRRYMSYQVWCVWDFMVLLKSIQRDLQGASSAWLPSPNPAALRCINAIIQDEEADEIGLFTGSHFEFFVSAMRMAGVSTLPIQTFLEKLKSGIKPLDAMSLVGAPACAHAFVGRTLQLSDSSLPERAAVLLHAREDLVPKMLLNLLNPAIACDPALEGMRQYVARHIYLDTEKHTALSERLLSAVTQPGEVEDALVAAEFAIRARILYLDEISADMRIEP